MVAVLDDGVVHPLPHMGGTGTELFYSVNHINHEVEAIDLIVNR